MAEDLNNESQFTEMLRIEFDVADFQQQLNLLAESYQDFLAKLSEMEGPQPLAGASVAALTENTEAQLAQIQEGLARTLVAVESVSEKVIDAITVGFEGLLERVKATDSAISSDAKKTAEDVGGAFKEQIDALKAQLQTVTSEQDAANIKLAQAYAKDEDIWRTVLANKQRFFEEYQARLIQIQEQAGQARARLHEAETALAARRTDGGANAPGGREIRARELQITALQEEAKAKEALEKETQENLDRLRADANNRELARQKGVSQSLSEISKQQFEAIALSQAEAEAAAVRASNASVAASRRANEAIIAGERAKIQQMESGQQAMLATEKEALAQRQAGNTEYFNQLTVKAQQWIISHAADLAKVEAVEREVWAESVQLAEQANARIVEIEKQRVEATAVLAEREKNLYAGVQTKGETRAPETRELGARQDEIAALRGQVAAYENQLKELRSIAAQTEGQITADKLNELDKRLNAVNKEVAAEAAAAETAVERRISIEQSANASFMTQLEASARQKLALKEQLVQAEQLAQQKITEYREAAAAAQRKLEERTGSFSFTEQQVNATKRMLAAYQDAVTKVEALLRQLQEVGEQAANNIDTAFTESNAKLVTNFEGTVNRIQAGLDRVIATEQRSGEGQGFFGRIQDAVRSLPGDLAETAVSLTKIMVLWAAIGKAIELVKNAILLLPRAIEAGFTYLGQMQEKAVELQAVIAQTTHLADGFGPNFQKSGVAAQQVVEQLRIKAAQLGLDFEKLVVTFKNLSEGGAPGMLKNLQEQVELTTTLELAMRAVASDQQESRRIQQEIPKLLDGTIDAQSRFLHVTHMSVDEWNALLMAGMQHHDLLQRIQERLKEFVEAGKTLPGTWENLVKQAGLFLSMVEGSLAKPLFIEMNRLLQDMVNYFVKNREQIEKMAGDIGEVTKGVVTLSEKVVDLTEKIVTLGGKVHWVGNMFEQMGHAISVTVKGANDLFTVLTTISGLNILEKLDFSHPLESFKKWGENVKQVFGDVGKAGRDATEQAQLDDVLKQSIAGSPLNDARNTKLASDAHKEYTDAVKKQKDAVEELHTKLQDLAQARQISPEQLNSRRIQSLKDEESAVIQLGYKYRIELATNPLIAAEEKTKRLKELEAEEASELARIHKEGLQARTQANRDAFAREEADYRENLEKIRSHFTQIVDAVKEAQARHTITTAEGVQQRKQLYKQELDATIALIDETKKRFQSLGVVRSDTIFNDLNKAVEAAKAKYANEVAGETKQGATSESQLERVEYNSRIALLEDFNKHQQALVKAAISDKLLSETQGVARLIELEEEDYQRRREVLVKETNDLNTDERTRAQATAKLVLLDQQHTEAAVLNAQRRLAAEEKETKAREALAKEEAALAVRDAELKVQAAAREAQTVERALANSRLIIDAKIKEAQVNVEVARTELLNAAAKGKTADEIRRLTDELRKAEQQLRVVTTGAVSQQGQAGGAARGQGARAEAAQEQQLHRNIQVFQQLYNVTQILIQAKLQEKAKIDAEIAELQNVVNSLRKLSAEHPQDQQLKQNADNAAQKLKQLEDTSAALDAATKDLNDDLKGADQSIQDNRASLDAHKLSIDTMKESVDAIIPILNLHEIWLQKDVNALTKFGETVESLSSTVSNVMNVLNSIKSGAQQGGVLGGIGGGLSSIGGIVSTINPLIGGIMQGVGQVFSFIGSMFNNKAKEIMRSIQAQTNETMKELQFQQLDLRTALVELQNQYNQASSELSGGNRQKTLESLGDQIRQIEFQMRQTVGAFQQLVQFGRIHNDQLLQFMQTWQQINRQAADYVEAGGSVRVAQEYVAQQLQQQQLQAQDQYLQGEQTAIQDALQLNDLYKQAVQLETDKFNLIKQEKQTEFNILTQDSIERRIPQAVQIYNQLTQQRLQFNQQLSQITDQQQQLQYELTIQSEKVAKEREMYGLATDIAGLHRQDEALSNYFLDEQLQKALAYKDIMTGIYYVGGWQGEALTSQFKTLVGLGQGVFNNIFTAFGNDLRNQQIITQEGQAFWNAQQAFAPGALPPNYNNGSIPYVGPGGSGPATGDPGLTAAIQNLQLTMAQFNQTLPGDIADAMPSIAQLLANGLTNPFLNVGKSVDNLTQVMTSLEAQIEQWLSTLGKGYTTALPQGPAPAVGPLVASSPSLAVPPTPTPATTGTVTTNQLLNAINQVAAAVTTSSTTQVANIITQTTQVVNAINKLLAGHNNPPLSLPPTVNPIPFAGGAGAVPNPNIVGAVNSLQTITANAFTQLNSSMANVAQSLNRSFTPRNTDMAAGHQLQIGQILIQMPPQAAGNPQAMADNFVLALRSRLAIGTHF